MATRIGIRIVAVEVLEVNSVVKAPMMTSMKMKTKSGTSAKMVNCAPIQVDRQDVLHAENNEDEDKVDEAANDIVKNHDWIYVTNGPAQ